MVVPVTPASEAARPNTGFIFACFDRHRIWRMVCIFLRCTQLEIQSSFPLPSLSFPRPPPPPLPRRRCPQALLFTFLAFSSLFSPFISPFFSPTSLSIYHSSPVPLSPVQPLSRGLQRHQSVLRWKLLLS